MTCRAAVVIAWLLLGGVAVAEEDRQVASLAGTKQNAANAEWRHTQDESGSLSSRTPAEQKKSVATEKKVKKVTEKKSMKKSDAKTDKKQPEPPVTSTPVKPLNLHLPSSFDEAESVEVGAALNLDVTLPDMFSGRKRDGRVSLDGRFLLEEDLEPHPGALKLDGRESQKSDKKLDYMDGFEGAEIKLRIRMD
jgi:hypothetical protein